MLLRLSFPLQHGSACARTSVRLSLASRVTCLLLSLAAAAPLAAQEAPAQAPAADQANGNAPPAGAPARAANDRLRGVSREDALLGGPESYRDPHRSALDANETQQSDLMRAERVPDALKGNGYDPLPPGGRKPIARAAGAGAGAGAGVAAPPDTPQQAVKSLYTDPFGGNAGAQPVYHTPW